MALHLRSGGPHHGQPIRQTGAPLGDGRGVGILLHGRGASAESILELADGVQAQGMTWLAPQAVGNTWYPNRFIAPIASNEPWLSSALDAVADVIAQAALASVPQAHVLLGGFSQGACLALEFVVRNPARYGAVAGLSGGLIGPPGTQWRRDGTLDGTPVFLGCSDVDAHIPKERVIESAGVLREMGAAVDAVLYPNMDHTVNQDEMAHLQALVNGLGA